MERDHDSSSFFPPLHQDEFPINFPYLSIWDDVGLDPLVFPDHDHSHAQNHKQVEGPKNLEETRKNEEVEKKIVHREIERQRRKEMTTLYASLRSVLPSNSIKGKRSASDQIHEATKYTRYMQNKVKQLEMKRDSMKKKSPELIEKVGSLSCSSKNLQASTVIVQRCAVGVEVLISCDDNAAEGRRRLRLSRILQLMLQEGLNVVDCNCSKFNGMLHFTIQSEVIGYPIIDLQMLQGKLTSVIGRGFDDH